MYADNNPTGIAPAIKPITRVDTPDISNSANHTVQNTTVWPKSGWSISNVATIAVSAPVNTPTINGVNPSLPFIDNSQATATMKQGFRNSDGWNCAMPTPSQRRAPFTSTPASGTSISVIRHTAQPIRAT